MRRSFPLRNTTTTTRRRTIRLLVVGLAGAILTSGVTAGPSAAQVARSAPTTAAEPTRSEDLDSLARELEALGWELVGDARTGVVPREGESMVVLADHRAYRQVDPPEDRRAMDPPPAPPDARQSAAPAEPDEPQNVIQGPVDNRILVNANLDKYPLRTVGTLSASPGPNAGGTNCTGTLVGPRHVLTAAHCLFDEGGFFTPMFFNPGQAGTIDTNGSPRPVVATFAKNYFINDASDYGVAILADSAATASLSWVPMTWLSDPSDYVGRVVQNYGYPGASQLCQASPLPNGQCGGFMYTHACLISDATDGTFKHGCDTTGAHSGGPMFVTMGTSKLLFGIHISGNTSWNTAVRLRPSLYIQACSWMKAFPSAFAKTPCV